LEFLEDFILKKVFFAYFLTLSLILLLKGSLWVNEVVLFKMFLKVFPAIVDRLA
jgi:hypothetical protein